MKNSAFGLSTVHRIRTSKIKVCVCNYTLIHNITDSINVFPYLSMRNNSHKVDYFDLCKDTTLMTQSRLINRA